MIEIIQRLCSVTKGLAPGHENLTDELHIVDSELQHATTVGSDLIERLPPGNRSWEDIVAAMLHSPHLVSDHDEKTKIDEYAFWRVGDGHHERDVLVVKAWVDRLVNDSDVLSAMSIDLDELTRIVSSDAHVFKNQQPMAPGTYRREKSFLDIGILRFPSYGYCKVYRLKIIVSAFSERGYDTPMFQNRIAGEYHCRNFESRKSDMEYGEPRESISQDASPASDDCTASLLAPPYSCLVGGTQCSLGTPYRVHVPTRASAADIPEELFEEVLSFLTEDASSITVPSDSGDIHVLASVALVCKYFAGKSRPHMYKSVTLRRPRHIEGLISVLGSHREQFGPSIIERYTKRLSIDPESDEPWFLQTFTALIPLMKRMRIPLPKQLSFRMSGASPRHLRTSPIPSFCFDAIKQLSLDSTHFDHGEDLVRCLAPLRNLCDVTLTSTTCNQVAPDLPSFRSSLHSPIYHIRAFNMSSHNLCFAVLLPAFIGPFLPRNQPSETEVLTTFLQAVYSFSTSNFPDRSELTWQMERCPGSLVILLSEEGEIEIPQLSIQLCWVGPPAIVATRRYRCLITIGSKVLSHSPTIDERKLAQKLSRELGAYIRRLHGLIEIHPLPPPPESPVTDTALPPPPKSPATDTGHDVPTLDIPLSPSEMPGFFPDDTSVNPIPTIESRRRGAPDTSNATSVMSEPREDMLTFKLAPSFGMQENPVFKTMDEYLKIVIGSIIHRIKGVKAEYRSWETVYSALLQNPLLEPIGNPIVKVDRLERDGYTWFKFMETQEKPVAVAVENWFAYLLADDDVREATQINIRSLAEVVAATGARVEHLLSLRTITQNITREKTVVDIGILRYPDIQNPFFKIYMIRLDAWGYSRNSFGIQSNKHGVAGYYNCCTFKPRDDTIPIDAKVSAVQAAEELFYETFGK